MQVIAKLYTGCGLAMILNAKPCPPKQNHIQFGNDLRAPNYALFCLAGGNVCCLLHQKKQ